MIEDKTRELPPYLSNTGLTDFRRCPARYYFRHLLSVEASGDKFSALEYGIAVHRAIPYIQRGKFDEGLLAFRSSWKDSGCEDDNKRNLLNAQTMLRTYYEKNVKGKNRPYTIIEPPKVDFREPYSDQEFAFCMNLTDHNIPFVGRIDAIGRRNDNGKIWGIEYKTTSELGQRFLQAFELNSQIYGYATVLSLYYGSDEVEGFFLEAFRVTSKKPETYTIPIFIHETQVEMFIELFDQTLDEITSCIENGKFLQDLTACTTYNQHGSPGYLCEYAPLCKCKTEESFNSLLKGAYRKRKDSPFKKLAESPLKKKET